MGNLEKRVAQIEGARANSDLKKMSDEELSAYTATLDWGAPTVIEALHTGNPRFVAAVLEGVLRHSSSLPIVVDDPERKAKNVTY
jgi:hypothetical protein